MTQKTINISGASGDQKLLDIATADRTRIFDYVLFVSAAGTIIVKDEAGSEFGRYTLPAAGSIVVDGLGLEPRFVAVGDLILNLSTTLTVTGHFTYATQ